MMTKPGPDGVPDIDELLDEALIETFPASDPPAVTLPHSPDEMAGKVSGTKTKKPKNLDSPEGDSKSD